MTATTKCQLLSRNGKSYWFFPDITVDDMTKGFLIDVISPVLSDIRKIWEQYCASEEALYFGVYINAHVESAQLREQMYTLYHSLPNSIVEVVGMTIPKQSVVIKKRRISTL